MSEQIFQDVLLLSLLYSSSSDQYCLLSPACCNKDAIALKLLGRIPNTDVPLL